MSTSSALGFEMLCWTRQAVVFAVLFYIPAMLCSTGEYNLLRNITASYDSSVRPVLNASHTVTVKVGIALNQIIDMDEKNQILKSMVWMRLYWTDEYFRWDPANYGGVSSLFLSPRKVWTPDVTLYNDVGQIGMTPMLDYSVSFYPDGSVMWLAPVPLSSACNLDIDEFPYDQQICNLTLGSWTQHGLQLDLQNRSATGDISSFNNNGEWSIYDVPVTRKVQFYGCCPEPYPILTFSIIMRRRPLFYIFNLLLPCVVIIATTAMGFLLPPDSGEKVSLLVTCMLSLTVFLLLVAETMPPNSAAVPLIGKFFAASIILVALSTVISVLILATHHGGSHGRKIPPFLKKLAFDWVARVICKRHLVIQTLLHHNGSKISKVHPLKTLSEETRIKEEIQILNFDQNDMENKDVVRKSSKTELYLKRIMHSVHELQELAYKKEADAIISEEWQLFGIILDQLFFYVFLFITAVMAVYIFTYSPTYEQ